MSEHPIMMIKRIVQDQTKLLDIKLVYSKSLLNKLNLINQSTNKLFDILIDDSTSIYLFPATDTEIWRHIQGGKQ
jgi:hypothetical protein